jgi:putative chitinase
VITIAALIAAGIAPTQARAFAEPLAAACARFGIDTPARVAAFVAQCRAESAGFSRLEEGLYYTTPERIRAVFPSRVPSMAVAAQLARNPRALANRVYAGRLGNGDEASGDGWAYRGRGLIQLTGRDNYAAAAAGCGKLYLERPDLVAQPEDACLTAAWFWSSAGLSALADIRDWNGITRRVNGPAMLHARERMQYTAEALEAFG